MGRRKGLNKKDIEKLLKKYGVAGTIGFFMILIAIDVFFYGLIYFKIYDSTNNNLVISTSVISIIVFGFGIFLMIMGKREIKNEQQMRIEAEENKKQRLIDDEKRRKKEEIQKYYKRLSLLSSSNIEDTDKMSGTEFEDFLQSLFVLLGYSVDKTKISGDFGADLILEKDDKIIVQAKRYNKKVSLSAIQEITAAKKHYSINNAWVVTNNYFTKPAYDLAADNNVRLIDREELARLILKSKNISENENIFENKIKQEFQKIDNNQKVIIPKQNNDYTNINKTSTNINKTSTPKDFIIHNYDFFFANKVFTTKESLISAYTKSDTNKINSLINEINALEIKTNENKISLHFFYQEIASTLYAMRYISENLIDECLKYCDKDIDILKDIKIDTPITVTTLTRKAIILEKRNNLKEAIDICDFAISKNFYDNGKPFDIRKAKLEKKLEETMRQKNEK